MIIDNAYLKGIPEYCVALLIICAISLAEVAIQAAPESESVPPPLYVWLQPDHSDWGPQLETAATDR